MKRNILIVIGIVLVTLGAMVGAYIGVRSGVIREPENDNGAPVVFSENRMLLELWSEYKSTILEPDTLRALDKSQDNITTSEGQSYTMMRAVWMDDRETFDTAWQWTKDNLQRDDNLMAWKFGEREDGSFGVLTDQGGQNTATDADSDIAYALIMASQRWKEDAYLFDARPILESMWEKQVVEINNKPVLVANDIERLNEESVIVNPSYFSPYAYRVFAQVDPNRNWEGLVDSSYELLFASADSTIDRDRSAGLIPNWIRVDRESGEVEPSPEFDSNYGYDALRTPWRLALDEKYYGEVRAKQVMERSDVLSNQWQERGQLASVYTHDGTVQTDDDVPAMYGGSIGYFMLTNPDQAKQVYERKLVSNYNPDTQGWNRELSYYDDNWAWFGIALYNDQLPNIAGSYGTR